MSIVQTYLVLLLIACLMLCSWARPKPQLSNLHNEVTYQEEDEDIHNDILRQLALMQAMASRIFNPKKPQTTFATQPYEAPLSSRFLGRVFTQPSLKYSGDADSIPPGGANYYSNYVPLSTYEISEPEALYY